MIKNLKLLRNQNKVSQQRLAHALGISQQSVNKYENHSVEPDIATLIAMADFFGVSVDYLIGRCDNENLSECEITRNELQMIHNCHKLTYNQKECVEALITTFKNQNK